MGRIADILGTVYQSLQIGIGGARVKNNAGVIEVRNAADSAYATMRAQVAAIVGDAIVLNEQATSTAASWKYTIQRPSTGMTHDITVIFPSADPAVNQALVVASIVGNVYTLGWLTVAAGTDKAVVDTTTIAFGSTSPLAMFTMPANAVVRQVSVVIDTPFNGTPTLSVGITGTTSKYLAANQVDLTAAATTTFEVVPGLPAPVAAENIIATYAAGSATAGSGRILVEYVIPS